METENYDDVRGLSHKNYAEFQFAQSKEYVKWIERYAPLFGKKVLELGCGTGGVSAYISLRGANVVSIDNEVYDKESIKTAKLFSAKKGAHIALQLGDAEKLAFRDECFDIVIMKDVLEHTHAPKAMLSEAMRVLRKDGLSFINFPLFYGPFGGHLDDLIKIPWYHILPKKMVNYTIYRSKVTNGFITPEHIYGVYLSLNRLSIHRFKKIIDATNAKIVEFRLYSQLTAESKELFISSWNAIRTASFRRLISAVDKFIKNTRINTFFRSIFLTSLYPLKYVPLVNEVTASGVNCVLRKRM